MKFLRQITNEWHPKNIKCVKSAAEYGETGTAVSQRGIASVALYLPFLGSFHFCKMILTAM